MKGKRHQLGLTLGLGFAFMHFIWALAVAVTPGGVQKYINWVFSLHFITIPATVGVFVAAKALVLIVLTFVVGYIMGWILAFCHDWVEKK